MRTGSAEALHAPRLHWDAVVMPLLRIHPLRAASLTRAVGAVQGQAGYGVGAAQQGYGYAAPTEPPAPATPPLPNPFSFPPGLLVQVLVPASSRGSSSPLLLLAPGILPSSCSILCRLAMLQQAASPGFYTRSVGDWIRQRLRGRAHDRRDAEPHDDDDVTA